MFPVIEVGTFLKHSKLKFSQTENCHLKKQKNTHLWGKFVVFCDNDFAPQSSCRTIDRSFNILDDLNPFEVQKARLLLNFDLSCFLGNSMCA